MKIRELNVPNNKFMFDQVAYATWKMSQYLWDPHSDHDSVFLLAQELVNAQLKEEFSDILE